MTIKGTITLALPEASGTSQSGKAWRRRSYVCRYDNSNEQYPKEILFDVMGEKIDELNIQQGGEYELAIDFSVREWNGRRFMSASAWKATRQDTPHATSEKPQGWQAAYPEPRVAPQQEPQRDSDLPF